MKYKPSEIDSMLERMVCLVDNREQKTEQYFKRIAAMKIPCERTTLSYGDYSAYTTDDSGNKIDMRTIAAIEKKMNLSELCTNFTTGRARFKREFERAKADGCHVHLLVEGDNYETLFAQKYRSKLLPQSLIASWLSWSIRYNLQLHFCKPETTPRLIVDILHYELREHLLNQ